MNRPRIAIVSTSGRVTGQALRLAMADAWLMEYDGQGAPATRAELFRRRGVMTRLYGYTPDGAPQFNADGTTAGRLAIIVSVEESIP